MLGPDAQQVQPTSQVDDNLTSRMKIETAMKKLEPAIQKLKRTRKAINARNRQVPLSVFYLFVYISLLNI